MEGVRILDGQLSVKGSVLLYDVPRNITLTLSTCSSSLQGTFVGASSLESRSRHIFPLGVLKNVRFMCCFRFSLWWMTQRMGKYGKDVPAETQFFLAETNLTPDATSDKDLQTVYTLFLPLLDGPFRASLQGNANDQLELCLDSGDVAMKGNGGLHSVFLHLGTNPFKVVEDALKTVQTHTQTFCRRIEKKTPDILNWFGWCTWNAFYTDVSADGIRQGLKSLEEGGTPARFIIIDDGWQSIVTDDTHQVEGESFQETPLARRLTNIKENHKFQKDGKEGVMQEDPTLGLQHLVREVKDKYKVKYVYAWHAIIGYWGGIHPSAEDMLHFESSLKYPVHSDSILNNEPGMRSDTLTIHGVGLAHPEKVSQFFDELHSYLASAGVDGVKVDVQNVLETLGTGFGGRVSLTRHYQQALEDSVGRYFPDNGCIACMSHNTDGLYSIKQTAVVRASDDFYPSNPATHTAHICSVAYNSLFLGEFMNPDWDMFQSDHSVAEFHGAARAVGGCPVYVSDKPENHNFSVLKKLVLPDGSILRAELPGRPTRDCLFDDPARDGKSLLKIWNLNKHTGVLGVFNCQGSGWCQEGKKHLTHDHSPEAASGIVSASDVEYIDSVASQEWNGDSAIYSHRGGKLLVLQKGCSLPVRLEVLEYEIFTVSPLKKLYGGGFFAPVGLLRMLNSGGSILDIAIEYSNSQSSNSVIQLKVHGCGEFGAYSSVKPQSCLVNEVISIFSYDFHTGFVRLTLAEKEGLYQTITFGFSNTVQTDMSC